MPLQAQAIKSKKEWVELFYNMAKCSKTEFDKIVATDVFDFWTIYDLWEQRIKLENAKNKIGAK